MAVFEKNICIGNIYFLSKEKGIKIGDLENASGVSSGYLSRLNREDNKTVPGIEFLLSVSKQLGVSIETLVSKDLSELTPDEIKLLHFFEKLIVDTNFYTISWIQDTDSSLFSYYCGDDLNYYATHPLMKIQNIDHEISVVYNSMFMDDEDLEIFNMHHSTLPNGNEVYIVQTSIIDEINPDRDFSGVELYLKIGCSVRPVCAVSNETNAIAINLYKLLDVVEESANHTHLSLDVKNAIDSYLEDEKLPNIYEICDDDLPF